VKLWPLVPAEEMVASSMADRRDGQLVQNDLRGSMHAENESATDSRSICPKSSDVLGVVVWLTGLSGAGKTTIANVLSTRLRDAGAAVCLVDGDRLRAGLCADLAFDDNSRHEQCRRAGELARLLCENGITAVVSTISPFRCDRKWVRTQVPSGRFIEVFVNAPLEECVRRDVKGLYRLARQGSKLGMTGIDSPYEPPQQAEIELRTDRQTVDECVQAVIEVVQQHTARGKSAGR
jgi:adenylyl-sulfate kinase